jgi:hypothetical protein
MRAFRAANLIIVVTAWALSASAASAQEVAAAAADPAPAPTVEVTPFVSLDSRGATPVGVAVGVPLGASFSLEPEFGYRRGEGNLNALSWSANLLYALPRIGRTTPYLAGGAGLAQYGVPIVSRDGASVIGTLPKVAFEVNAGGGVKVDAHETWDLRTDARWFKSFGRNGSEHWRVSQGLSFDMAKR